MPDQEKEQKMLLEDRVAIVTGGGKGIGWWQISRCCVFFRGLPIYTLGAGGPIHIVRFDAQLLVPLSLPLRSSPGGDEPIQYIENTQK